MICCDRLIKEFLPHFKPVLYAFLVALILSVLSGCAYIQLGPSIGPLEEVTLEGEGDEKILLLEIEGVIGNKAKRSLTGFSIDVGMVEKVREILKQASEDDAIRGLLVRINSPGGTVTSSDIIFHELQRFKQERNIPVYVAIVDLAASGGYYIAQAGDLIMAHPTSLIGSIGVIAMKVNLTELMGKVGVDWEIVKSGDKKDFLSPFRALTEEERRLFQDTIDQFHDRFVRLIADNRPELSYDQALIIADGRVYTAEQALGNKLIDKIAYFDEMTEHMKTHLGVDALKIVTYQRSGDFKSNLYSQADRIPPTVNLFNIDIGMDWLPSTPQFMYLWAP
ncbi:MAG: signal peptide peptidase SppA [Candidatus Nitrohelix vancouverensis]|uniref:Signal peptide peptidase SppA n=1 Tax=Candidatus Nitrohelix vancouverensis TaxID=2705534 RepID=A0A7T0C3H4_9BACT|nr:MAG: signal peptide peptidase SppA [Candidatus Nitrohelix vancouverensis]